MKMRPPTLFAACIPLLLVLGAAPALAQPEGLGVGQKRPWAQGISPTNQAAANTYFQNGNVQLENTLFAQAIEQYEKALALWDHPSIHYNMALALVNLKEPVKLRKHLKEALRYDGQPLDAHKIGRTRDLLKLVEGQLVHLKVSCDVPGASVKMNGTELFVGPGHYEDWVLPDQYIFTAEKKGLPSNERRRTPVAGQELVLNYKLYTVDEMTRGTRLWPAWRPWAVVGLGAVLAGGGFLLQQQSASTYRRYDEAVALCSGANDSRGCTPTQELLDQESRGNLFKTSAAVTYGLSGAVAVTGLVLAYTNRLRTEVVTPDEHEKSLQVVPVVGADQGGVVATFRF